MVLSSTEIKKKIIHEVLDFSLNIESNRQSGLYSSVQINEMMAVAIEINNLINFLDKDPTKLSQLKNYKKPNLNISELKKLKRTLELSFRYGSDINSVAIDLGENISLTNRLLTQGVDYIFENIKNKDLKTKSQNSPKKITPSQTLKNTPLNNKVTTMTKRSGVNLMGFIFFLIVIAAIAIFVYNLIFDRHATKVTSLVKEYRSDRKLSSVSRPAQEADLKLRGTMSLLKIFAENQKSFENQNPRLRYQLESEDSGVAISKLIDGEISLAATSKIPNINERKKAANNGKPLADHKMALDSVVFFVNTANTLETISLEEIKTIYHRDSVTWQEAIPLSSSKEKITKFSLSKESGTFEFFKDRVMFGETTSGQVVHIYTPEQMLEMVASNPNAIGFCSLSVFMTAQPNTLTNLKIVKISSSFDEKGSKPTTPEGYIDAALVKRGEYPLTRYLYLISAGEITDAEARFIDFMRSEQIQSQLTRYGLVGIN